MDAKTPFAPNATGPGYARYPNWREWWLVSRFRERYPHDIPTPGHLQCMAAIVDGLGSPWNISTKWKKCQWYHTAKGAISLAVCGYGRGLSTYDSDRLTALVLAAHAHSVRVEVEPCNFRYMRITFWPRDERGSSFAARHPTLSDLEGRIGKLRHALAQEAAAC